MKDSSASGHALVVDVMPPSASSCSESIAPRERTAPRGPVDVRALFLAHGSAIRSAMYRCSFNGADVDDWLQEVFVIALRRQAELERAVSPKAWLFGVGLRIAAAKRRAHRVRRFLGLEALDDVPETETPLSRLEATEEQRMVRAAIDRLSAKMRSVFVLYELEGLSGEEIALAVGCPVATVWTRLFHARKLFRRHLQRARGRP